MKPPLPWNQNRSRRTIQSPNPDHPRPRPTGQVSSLSSLISMLTTESAILDFPPSVRGHVDTAPCMHTMSSQSHQVFNQIFFIASSLNTWPFWQHLIDPGEPAPRSFQAEIHDSPQASHGLFYQTLSGLANALSSLPQAVGSLYVLYMV